MRGFSMREIGDMESIHGSGRWSNFGAGIGRYLIFAQIAPLPTISGFRTEPGSYLDFGPEGKCRVQVTALIIRAKQHALP